MDRPLAYQAEVVTTGNLSERMVMNPIEAFVSPSKARRTLGLTSAVPTPRALELTLEWVRHARLAAFIGNNGI
jgi:hypothetical protein